MKIGNDLNRAIDKSLMSKSKINKIIGKLGHKIKPDKLKKIKLKIKKTPN